MENNNQIYTGLVDLQVNGFLGVDFSSDELTEHSCERACRELLKKTEIFLPTVITSPMSLYERNLKIISSMIRTAEFAGRIAGVHLEGPFISSKPGAIGAHNPQWVQECDKAILDKLMQWADGKIRLLTIAADAPGAEELAKYAVSLGITVSLGHQDASLEQLKSLAQSGATLLTHLGNALPNMIHRHNNLLLYGLAVDELGAMIVTDGHHLPAHLIKTILRVKGIDNVIATSDASPIAGMPAGEYNVLGNQAVLEDNGLLHNPKGNHLVGSSSTMLECADYLKSLNLLSEQELEKITRTNALKAIGLL